MISNCQVKICYNYGIRYSYSNFKVHVYSTDDWSYINSIQLTNDCFMNTWLSFHKNIWDWMTMKLCNFSFLSDLMRHIMTSINNTHIHATYLEHYISMQSIHMLNIRKMYPSFIFKLLQHFEGHRFWLQFCFR